MLFQHMTYVLICRDVMLGFVQSISVVGMDCTSGQFMKVALFSLRITYGIVSKNLNYLQEPSFGNIDDRKILAMHIFWKHLPLTKVLSKEIRYWGKMRNILVCEHRIKNLEFHWKYYYGLTAHCDRLTERYLIWPKQKDMKCLSTNNRGWSLHISNEYM